MHERLDAGVVATAVEDPPRPWLRIQGSNDATTLWHAVLRKQERGIFIGTLVLRHGDHHALLLTRGWEEILVDEMRDRAIPEQPAAGS